MSKPLELLTEAPTENQIRNAIVDFLVYHHFLVIRVNSGAAVTTENGKRRYVQFVKWSALGHGAQTAGVSDLICFKSGLAPIAIECKRPGNTPTETQERFMAEWTAHGGVAITATSTEDVQQALGL